MLTGCLVEPQKLMVMEPPLLTNAMSAYPYSAGLEGLYTFDSAFGESVCGAVRQGNTLWVPRESVPYATGHQDFRTSRPPQPLAIDCTFRHEQGPKCQQSLAFLQAGRSHIFEAPTGWGKTVAGSWIAARLGQPTLIVVTKDDLMQQWKETLTTVLHIPASLIGHVQADVEDWEGKRFVLGMVQCVDPSLRILNARMQYVAAGDVKVGDELVGFDEHSHGERRRFRKAVVEAVARRQSSRVQITFDGGQKLVVSRTHCWLVRKAKNYSDLKWKQSCDLKSGDQIPRVAPLWEAQTDFEAGWLSGIADGEGCLTTRKFGCDFSIAQREGLVWQEIKRVLTSRGYQFRERERDLSKYESTFGADVMQLKITRMGDVMRFIGEFQPRRLREKKFWDGRRFTQVGQVGLATVVAVQPIPDGEVVSLQTSTHTFVAEGLASHNSLIIPNKYTDAFYRYFGLMILDEVHLMAADCFVRVCQLVAAKYRLGFSATPTRRDGKTRLLHWHIGPTLVRGVIQSMSPKVLVRQTGWRIPMRRMRSQSWVLEEIPHEPGRMMLVAKAMAASDPRNMEIVNFVVQAYKAGRVTLILSDLRESHLDRLFQMLTNEGVPGEEIGYYVGGMKKHELAASKKRKVILGTYKMCSTGTDVPVWDSLVMATPRADVKQIVGRVTRSVPGKKQPVVLDLVDVNPIFQNFHLTRLKQYYALGATDIVKV